MSPSRAAQEAVQRHAWANKTTGWLPRLGELDDPVRLGVHRAVEIDTSEADNPNLTGSVPAYIPRDIDMQLDAAISQGGFVLVVGDTAAGKTRAAYEALRRMPQDMSLLVPRSQESLRAIVTSGVELADTVVWLDNLDRYLGPDGLDVALLHSLTGPGTQRVVVLATIRTNEYLARLPGRGRGPSSQELHLRRERELLDQGQRMYVEFRFSQTEYERAVQLTRGLRRGRVLAHLKEWFADLPGRTRTDMPGASDSGWSVQRSGSPGGKFVLKKGTSGKYHFDLIAGNGQLIASSETYDSKQSALRGIESIKRNALDAQVEDIAEA